MLQKQAAIDSGVDEMGRCRRRRRRGSGSRSDSGSSDSDSGSDSGSGSGRHERRDSGVPRRQVSSYVHLKGLPFQASEQEVSQWFASAPGGPINVLRVRFAYSIAGRKNGEAVRAPRLCACPVPHSLLPLCATGCRAARAFGGAGGAAAAQAPHAVPLHRGVPLREQQRAARRRPC
jgi:hypothetical protein